MKRKKRIVIGLGITSVLAAPIIGVASCGSNTENPTIKEQKQLDGITSNMVNSALNIKANSAEVPSNAYPTQPKDKVVELNGLAGVNIKITAWSTEDATGVLTYSVSLSKDNLTSKTLDITVAGFKASANADQNKMDGITDNMVLDALALTIDPFKTPSQVYNVPPAGGIHTLNNLSGVQIRISDWTLNDSTGTITFTATMSKDALTPRVLKISVSGFGTQAHVQIQTKINAIEESDVTSLMGITASPTVLASSAESKVKNKYSVTLNTVDGLDVTVSNISWSDSAGTIRYNAVISKDGFTSKRFTDIMITNFKRVAPGSITNIKEVGKTFSGFTGSKFTLQINQTHYLLGGSNHNPLYQVTTNLDGDVISSVPYTGVDASFGRALQMDDTHIILSKPSEGMYVLTIDPETGLISGKNKYPGRHYVRLSKIDNRHAVNGRDLITLTPDGSAIQSIQSQVYGKLGTAQFAQMVDSTHMLYGSISHGLFEVVIDPTTKAIVSSKRNLSIDGNFAGGWITKINDQHYILCSSSGEYIITIDPDGTIANSIYLPFSGTGNHIPVALNHFSSYLSRAVVMGPHIFVLADVGLYRIDLNDSDGIASITKVADAPQLVVDPNMQQGYLQKVTSTSFLANITNKGTYLIDMAQ